MVLSKKIYRKEDIISMNSCKAVNYGWAEKGKQEEGYSIWFYKGGGFIARHKWVRKTYMYRP